MQWLGSVKVNTWDCDPKVKGSTNNQVVTTWLTVCKQVNHLSIWPTPKSTQPSIPPG